MRVIICVRLYSNNLEDPLNVPLWNIGLQMLILRCMWHKCKSSKKAHVLLVTEHKAALIGLTASRQTECLLSLCGECTKGEHLSYTHDFINALALTKAGLLGFYKVEFLFIFLHFMAFSVNNTHYM